jgi:hypothetical protein
MTTRPQYFGYSIDAFRAAAKICPAEGAKKLIAYRDSILAACPNMSPSAAMDIVRDDLVIYPRLQGQFFATNTDILKKHYPGEYAALQIVTFHMHVTDAIFKPA